MHKAIPRAHACVARRSLMLSARLCVEQNTSPGKPVTAQAVKAEFNRLTEPPKPAAKPVQPVKPVVPAKPAVVPPAKPVVPVKPVVVPPKKKGFSLFGLLWRSVLVLSVAYGGTLYAATKNEKVMDFVIDKQLPYYEELIDAIENGSVDDVQAFWKKLTSSVPLPSKNKIEELTTKLEKQGEHLIEETKKKLAHQEALPAHQLQKAVEFEPVHGKIEKIPFVTLKDGMAGVADDTVKATIKSFNDLLVLVDGSNLGPQKDTMVRQISENVLALSTKLAALNNSFEEELQAKLKTSETELLSKHTEKELELTRSMLDQYNYEKLQLEKKYKDRLAKEVEAAKANISQAAVNAITMMRVEQVKKFEASIKERLDTERNGRLKNLDALNSRLEELENFAISLESEVCGARSRTAVQSAAARLKALVFNVTEDAPAKRFAPYIDALEAATEKSNDEVIALALAELKPLLKGESSQSLLTVPQLLTAWEQLAPELRSASLLPPNAGLMGHMASILFSKLLMPVKGARADGRDIESVIARVELALVRNELDVAVEDVANLKGWTRKLADDWVREGRRRLEAELLVSLIDAEVKVL